MKEGAPRSLLTAHSTEMNEVPRNEPNDLNTVRARCSCTRDHVAGGQGLGTSAHLNLGPHSEDVDSAAHRSAS